jgi:hypothetical protein
MSAGIRRSGIPKAKKPGSAGRNSDASAGPPTPTPASPQLDSTGGFFNLTATYVLNRRDNDCQTDAAYPCGDLGRFDAAASLTEYHCKQYKQLLDFREHCKGLMTELGGSVYDMLALKDIFLKMSDHLPHAPLTDLLLVSSKVYRRSGELARSLGMMFSTIFADDFVDSDFKFTESRITKKTIRKLEAQLAEVTAERDDLKAKHDALSAAARSHREVVDKLQDENDDVASRNAVLEDNMAVLFQQLATDFSEFSEGQLADAQEDLAVQDALSSARSQFTASIDAVQNRLRFFQTSLGDIQADAANYDPTGTIKSKLKSLDVHAAQLTNRFGAVRDGLVNTAEELVGVLKEKRKILNFSLQHLRAYEVQNQRMRQSRQVMHELRQQLIEVERVFTSTFAAGALVKIERSGDINVSLAAAAGSPSDAELAAKRSRFAAGNTKVIADLIKGVVSLGHVATTALAMDDEHKAVLRAVSLAIPATRTKAGPDGESPHRSGSTGGNAFGGDADATSSAALSPRRAGAAGGATSSALVPASPTSPRLNPHLSGGGGIVASGVDQAAYLKLREDFSVKASFLREVYEERITDLESRVEQLQKRLTLAKREAEEDKAALARALEGGSAQGAGGGGATDPATGKPQLDDKAAAVRTKEAWLRYKQASLGAHSEAAHDALEAMAQFELRGAEKSYVSPFAAFARIARSRPDAARSASGVNTVGDRANAARSVAMPASARAGMPGGNVGSAALRTEHARRQHEANVSVIRNLRRLAENVETLAGTTDEPAAALPSSTLVPSPPPLL